MGFISKFIAKWVVNIIVLYFITRYFPGFLLSGGIPTLFIGALVLTVLNVFVRPILRLIATPLVWITFGLFNILIHIFILWLADSVLTQIQVADLYTLFWASIVLAVANSFF